MAVCYLYIRTMHTFIRTVICEPSNCGKTKLISLLENPYENISCTRNRCKQPKYQYLTNLVLIEKNRLFISFIFSNNNSVIPLSEALPSSIFIFDDVACGKQDANKRILYNGTIHGHQLLLSLSDVREDEASYATMQIC